MEVLQLAPAPRPIGISQTYINQRVETLIFNDADLQTVDGQSAFKVDGETFSLSGRMHFYDCRTSTSLFDIRKDNFTLHRTYCGENEAGGRIFTLQKKFQRKFHSNFHRPGRGTKTRTVTSKVICSFTSITGEEDKLTVDGDFFDTGAQISTEDGQVVAIVDRKRSNIKEFIGSELWEGKQVYYVAVAASVDVSLIAAICMCLCEWKNDGWSAADSFLGLTSKVASLD